MLTDDDFVDDPLPPALAVDVEPLSDEELEIFHEWGGDVLTPEQLAEKGGVVEDDDGAPLPAAAHWMIEDDESAEWAGRKFRECQDIVADVEAHQARWVKRIQEWAAKQTAQAQKDAAYFQGQLERYMERRREESRYVNKKGEVAYKVKSLNLPSVKLGSRHAPAKMVVDEADDLVAWVKTLGLPDLQLAAVKETFLVSGVKESVRFEEEPVGWDYELECGCTQRESFEADSPLEAEEDLMCATHHEHTSVLQAEPVVQLQAWLIVPATDDSEEQRHRVPSVHVDPESVTFSVKPNE